MIFLGDLACPGERVDALNQAIGSIGVLSDQIVVVNLEAVILRDGRLRPNTLYNHPSVLNALQKKAKKVIVSLANNHMYDYPEEIVNTKSYLENNGIGVVGLYDNNGDIIPYEFEDESEKYAVFGHCWDLYSATNPNRINDVRIVDCEYPVFLNVVREYISKHPDCKVYCFMHWNYDLELLPFPMHIKFAHDLIDIGVSGVIGSHSHVTHAVELYKDRPISYCLGNFYLPSGVFFDGKLVYPQKSKTTIGIRIENIKSDVLLFETDQELPVKFVKSLTVSEFSSSFGFEGGAYKKYFRKNRTKKFLVPVFTSYSGWQYKMKKFWAIQRVKLVKKLLNR